MKARIAGAAFLAAAALAASRADAACLSSGDQNTINSLFAAGGANTIVSLCPGVSIILTDAIVFTAPGQELSTQGYPIGGNLAQLIVTGGTQSTAIQGNCDNCSGVKVRNIVVYGNRPALGQVPCGSALMEMGGNTSGQAIDNVIALEARGWSTLHVFEGSGRACSGARVTNGTFGPAGMPGYAVDSSGQLLLDCNGHGYGQWADGISFACSNGLVQNNTVVDATDGGIVVFGAPGSQIIGNTVTALSRTLMGGINLVDYGPFSGNYTGTLVSGNTINAASAMIKVGIAVGPPVWGDTNPAHVNSGGTVRYNRFQGTQFGYPLAVAGVSSFTVRDNVNTGSLLLTRGSPSTNWFTQPPFACPSPASVRPQPWVFDPSNSSGDFTGQALIDGHVGGLICIQPTLARQVVFSAGQLGLTYNTGIEVDTSSSGAAAPGYLVMQSDGNLVMYRGAPGGAVTGLWTSNTPGRCTHSCWLLWQHDGNLVIYDRFNGTNTPVWNTNTVGRGATLTLSGQAPYLAIKDSTGATIWHAP